MTVILDKLGNKGAGWIPAMQTLYKPGQASSQVWMQPLVKTTIAIAAKKAEAEKESFSKLRAVMESLPWIKLLASLAVRCPGAELTYRLSRAPCRLLQGLTLFPQPSSTPVWSCLAMPPPRTPCNFLSSPKRERNTGFPSSPAAATV